MSLSAIFKGHSMIFGATGVSMLLGGMAGGLMIYSYQNVPTKTEHWNKLWHQYRSKYPLLPPWEQQSNDLNILNANNNECLNLIAPKLQKLSNAAQVKSLRILVPLCGATNDLEIINDYMTNKIASEASSADEAKQYRLKVIGVDASKDALQMFLDKVDIKEKALDPNHIDYNKEYNFPKNKNVLYQIDEDVFSKIEIYKHNNYHLINSDIFDAAMHRLILRADAVYDHQSFSIINPKRREQYVYLMQNIVNRRAKILLVTERFDIEHRDQDQRAESPYAINGKDEIFSLYKKLINNEPKNIKLLKSIPWTQDKLNSYGFSENYKDAHTDIWLLECQR